MTENEAKQWLKHTRAYQHKCDNCEYIDIKGACNEECKDFYDMAIQALEEIQQYRAIGTLEEIRALKEKSEPKKPRWHGHHFCPHCNNIVYVNAGKDIYCPKCGQALDWSE